MKTLKKQSLPSNRPKYIDKFEPIAKDIVVYEKDNKINNKRLTKVEISHLLSLIAEGRNFAYIHQKMIANHGRDISYTTVVRYKEKYALQLASIKEDFEYIALNEGLSRRDVRVKRMQDMANALEDVILDEKGQLATGNLRTLTEYRELNKQIAIEVGDMPAQPINVTFNNMTDDELKDFIASKMAQHKDMSVILAEKAGVRPTSHTLDDRVEQIIDAKFRELPGSGNRSGDNGTGAT